MRKCRADVIQMLGCQPITAVSCERMGSHPAPEMTFCLQLLKRPTVFFFLGFLTFIWVCLTLSPVCCFVSPINRRIVPCQTSAVMHLAFWLKNQSGEAQRAVLLVALSLSLTHILALSDIFVIIWGCRRVKGNLLQTCEEL